ncbi:MAG TPA: hypothetical protein VFD70_26910 [Anaerolineae bacterium]|nr:hypothetical protein [Anaerolineae bacterium]
MRGVNSLCNKGTFTKRSVNWRGGWSKSIWIMQSSAAWRWSRMVIPRFTEDVAILMTPEGLAAFRERLLGRGYLPLFQGAQKSFRDTRTGIRIEVVTTGDYPGDGKPKPVSFPNPKDARFEREGLWLITLEKLIELKLASGLSAPHRLKDLSDVQDLIIRLNLPLDFQNKLDPSVRSEYQRLWESAQSARDE